MTRWFIPLLLTAAAACSAPAGRLELPLPSKPPAARVLTVNVIERGKPSIRKVALEEYVQGSILSEFSPAAAELSLAERMYEVQAVISRTYAVTNLGRHARDGFDLCSTTHCQVYEPGRLRNSRWAQAAVEAARRTASVVLWYDTAPARAVFHADCGGHTSAAAAVWGGRDRPYLAAVPDDGAAASAHTRWQYDTSRAELLGALNADPRTNVGDRIDTIEVLDRDAAGRARQVALHGRREAIVSGEALREVLTRSFGPRAIRSTSFTVRREKSLFRFEGRGFGHGVGLCQAGAVARLRAGATPSAVLHQYFPGTTLRMLN